MPILYSSHEGEKSSRFSLNKFFEILHPHLRKKYPKVADQIITGERDAPEEPVEPIRPMLADDASDADKAIYAVNLQIYLTQVVQYEKNKSKWVDKMEAYEEEEKACVADFWETIGEDLRADIQQKHGDIQLQNDLIALTDAVRELYIFSPNESDRSKIIQTNKQYMNLHMEPKERLFAFHKRFVELYEMLEELNYDKLESEPERARHFLEALDGARFGEMLVELQNKESEYTITKHGEDPWPSTLDQAYRLAASRKSMKKTSTGDSTPASTLSAHFKGADTFGKGGGERPSTKKSDKKKAKGLVKAESDKHKKKPPMPCTLCGGTLNDQTGDEDHWNKECPFNRLSFDERAKLYRQSKAGAKAPQAKSEAVKSEGGGGKRVTVTFNEDEADEEDYPFASTNYSLVSLCKPSILPLRKPNTAQPLSFMIDDGATIFVFCNKNLLSNIRPNPNFGNDSVVTGNGTREYKEIGDSDIYGTVYYDPKQIINILPYGKMCRRFDVYEHRPVQNEPREYYRVFYPQFNEYRYFRRIRSDGIYCCDFSDWYNLGKFHAGQRPRVQFNITGDIIANGDGQPIYSRRQLLNIEALRSSIPDIGFLSLRDLAKQVRHGHLDKCPWSEQEVMRAIRESVTDVSTLRGKTVKQAQPSLDFARNLQPRELALHGDLMKLWSMWYLVLVTQPGGYVIMMHLADGKSKASLVVQLKAGVAHLKAFGWVPKILVFDGESAICWLETEINELELESVPQPPEVKVVLAEHKIKLIKARARCIKSRIVNQLRLAISNQQGKWITICAAVYTNWIASKANPDNMPPMRFITNIKLDFSSHMRVSSGDYCEIFNANTVRNSPDDRTSPAIALAPTLRGYWWFLKISENMQQWAVVKRSQYTRLPVSHAIRALCAQYAALHPLVPDPSGADFSELEGVNPSTLHLDDPSVVDLSHEPLPSVASAPSQSEPSIIHADEQGVIVPTPSVSYVPVASDIVHADDLGTEFPDGPPSTLDTEFPDAQVQPQQTVTGDTLDDQAIPIPLEVVPPRPPAEPPPTRRYSTRSKDNTSVSAGLKWKTRRLGATGTKYADSYMYAAISNDCCFLTQMQARKALSHYGKDALKVLVDEIDSILSRRVWSGVLRSALSARQLKLLIRSQALVTPKYTPKNEFERLKARLVGLGNQQDKSTYFREELSSPTVSTTSIFICIAVAANEKRHVMCFDVGTAYLNADMEHDVYMELDPLISAILIQRDATYEQFLDDRGRIIVKLNKALYGCVESAKLWYKHLRAVLESIGYTVNPHDICVFNRISVRGFQSTVLFHVDDGMATCEDLGDLLKLKGELCAAFTDVKFKLGPEQEFLGMILDFKYDGFCQVTTPKLIQEIISDFQVKGKARYPANTDLFKVDDSSPLLSDDKRKRFHSGVQKLLYISTRARMDLSTAVGFLTTRVLKATEQDWGKFMQTLCYLNTTIELGLRLGGNLSGYISVNVFADSAHGVHNDSKGHSGIIVSLGRGAVLAKSPKQRIVARSSAESEVISQSDSLGYGLHVLQFCQHQGYDILSGKIYQDNEAAIKLGEAGRSTSDRTRHIRIRYFFVKQFIETGEMVLVYCPTDRMIADLLTKPIVGQQFIYLRDLLLGYTTP